MADLTIPDVPEETHAAIRARAAAEGRSVAQELRALVERTYAPPEYDAAAQRGHLEALARSLPDRKPELARRCRERTAQGTVSVEELQRRLEVMRRDGLLPHADIDAFLEERRREAGEP